MIADYFHELFSLADSVDRRQVEELVEVLYKAYRENRQIFMFGNGGSAALASHFCEDIGKGTLRGPNDRMRFRVVSLTDNVPYLLAWANDEGYESVFEQQLCNLADEGDVAIAISGSGNSRNVLRAIEYANLHGMVTVALTGYDGGELSREVNHLVHIPSFDMGMVESFHLIIAHFVVDRLKERIGKRQVSLEPL